MENPRAQTIDDITIERARVADAARILEIQRLAYQSEANLYGDPTIPPMVQILEELEAEFEKSVILKAVLQAAIVGSVRAHQVDASVYLGRLVVHPALQKLGIGTRLMAEIEVIFPQAERFELFTGHRSEGNLRLYSRLGYRQFRVEVISPQLTLLFLEKKP